MSETRRQVFKTSVISALGLASLSALTACSVTTPTVAKQNVPILMFNTRDSSWYAFLFVSADLQNCQVFRIVGATPPSPAFLFDTAAWFNSLSANAKVLVTTSVTLTSTDLNGANITLALAFTDRGNLNSDSLSSLNTLLNSAADFAQAQGSWNEIGKF